MNALAQINPRRATRGLSRIDRILIGSLLVDGHADVVDLAERAGVTVFDMARAAYGLAQRGLARVTETQRAAVRRVDPSPELAAAPAVIRLRCMADYVGSVDATRKAVLA